MVLYNVVNLSFSTTEFQVHCILKFTFTVFMYFTSSDVSPFPFKLKFRYPVRNPNYLLIDHVNLPCHIQSRSAGWKIVSVRVESGTGLFEFERLGRVTKVHKLGNCFYLSFSWHDSHLRINYFTSFIIQFEILLLVCFQLFLLD